MRLPTWVYDIVMALQIYEETHPDAQLMSGHHTDNGCVADILNAVPANIRDAALAIRDYNLSKTYT